MTLRRRLVLVAAAAVAVTIVLASAIVYVVVRGELRGRVDDELRTQAPRVRLFAGQLPPTGDDRAIEDVLRRAAKRFTPPPRDPLGLPTSYRALVGGDGTVVPNNPLASSGVRLPVTAATRAVANDAHAAFFSDATIHGTPVRVYTSSAPIPGIAVQTARSLADVNRTLDRLLLVLVLVSAGGIALAAALGRVIARTALHPVAQLTDAAEHVAATSDLSRRIEVRGEDELSRLARTFNTMLSALETSVGRQRQLVADASHELRTPLTSLRTNIEVLQRGAALSPEERDGLLADVVAQLDELGALVGDVVELARDEEREHETEELRFDALVTDAIARAVRRPAAPSFATRLAPCVVRGAPARLDRAVSNLLDNAVKWSPPDAAVEVALTADGELTVRDHGPGIRPADLPHVFDRFYRAAGSRGLPGSGLGLAIVRQVVETHGGAVAAEVAPGGGALLRLRLPAEPLAVGDEAGVTRPAGRLSAV